MDILNKIALSPALYASLEWTVVAFNLIFLILMIKEQMACWFFGIIGSLLAVFLFLTPTVRLYSEAILYFVYAVMGVYGWITWHRKNLKAQQDIVTWNWKKHLVSVLIGVITWLVISYIMKTYTNASKPMADAFSTAFGLVATWLEAQKILEGWIYWLIVNVFSVWLYLAQDINKMAGMMVVFSVLSVVGYLRWHRQYKVQRNQPIN